MSNERQADTSTIRLAPRLPRRVKATVYSLALGGLILLAAGPQNAFAQAQPAANSAPSSDTGGRRYLTRTFTVRDVELATLLERLARFGVRLPVEGSGKVTAEVTVSVPWRTPFTLRNYRFRATLTSPDLTLEGLDLHTFEATLDFTAGVLTLDRLRFALLDSQGQPAGTLMGNAALQVDPRGDLTARLTIDRLRLAELVRRLPTAPPVSDGLVSGSVNARVPWDRVRDLLAWQARGKVEIADLRSQDLPAAAGSTSFDLNQGTLVLDPLSGSLAGVQLSGASARLGLTRPFRFRANLGRATGQLQNLAELAARFGVNEPVSGQFALGGNAQGTLEPLVVQAAGNAELKRLLFERLHIDRLTVDYAADAAGLALRNLQVQLYGGRAGGSAALPLDPRGTARFDLNWQTVQVATLARDLALSDLVSRGTAWGRLSGNAPMDRLRRAAAWQVRGDVGLDDAMVQGLPVRRATADLDLRNAELFTRMARVELGRGEVLASLRARLRSPYPANVNFSIRDLDLTALAALLPTGVPRPTSGLVNLNGRAKAELASNQLTARGNGTLAQLVVAGVRLDSAAFAYGLSPAGLSLENVDARLYGGAARGSATVPLDPHSPANVDVRWDAIDLGRVVRDLRILDEPLTARARGTARFSLPAGDSFSLDRLTGSGHAEVGPIDAPGLRGGQAVADLRVAKGALQLNPFDVRWPGTDIGGNLRVELANDFAFDGQLRVAGTLESLPLRDRLPRGDELSGVFGFQSDVRGTLQPLKILGRGQGSIADVRVDNDLVGGMSFHFVGDGETLTLERLTGQVYGGELRGSAVVPLVDTVAGNARVEIQAIDFGRLANHLVRLPVRLSATTHAGLSIDIPPGELMAPEAWHIDARLQVPTLEVNQVPVGNLQAELEADRGLLRYTAEGGLLGGRVDVNGVWHEQPDAEPNTGLVRLAGLQLNRLAPALSRNPSLRDLAGQIDFDLPLEIAPHTAWPTGSGELRITDLQVAGVRLVDRVQGAVRLEPGLLRVVDLGGGVAQGELRAAVLLDLNRPARSWFTASLNAARAEDLLAAWPSLRGTASGIVDLGLRGSLARPWRVDGTLTVNQGRVLGVEATDIRLPMVATIEPTSGSLELNVPDGSGQVGHGRAEIRLSLRSTHANAVSLELRLQDADLRPLFAQAGSLGQLAGGQATATLVLSGQDVRSLNDLSGTLQAQLRNVQPTGLPVFQQLGPYLAGGLSGSGFDRGELRARIGGGVITVEQLAMTGVNTQLFATGRVTFSQALDLSVAVSNYQGVGGMAGSTILARLPIAGVTPVGWLLAANQFLANRVVYLDVNGTVSSPVIRVRPLPSLTNEAARFFLGAGF